MTFYLENSLWTIVSLVGLALAAYAAVDARGDLEALRLLGKNGQKKILAQLAFRSEIVRMMVQGLFLTAGIYTFFQPMPRTEHNPVAIIFLLAIVLAASNSVQAILSRRAALTMSTDRENLRDDTRDKGRDEGRDPVRDAARDVAHDKEMDK